MVLFWLFRPRAPGCRRHSWSPPADGISLIVEDLDRLVALVLLVEADLERVVVLDDAVEVLLGVEIDVFRALLVLEGQLVGLVGVPSRVLSTW